MESPEKQPILGT